MQIPSPIMNDEVHKDGDDFERPNIHSKPHGGNDDDANEDHVNCLSSIFPNTDDNPVEYVYTRDSSGRVVSIEARLKEPRNEAAVTMEATDAESRHDLLSGKPSFKADVDGCVKKSKTLPLRSNIMSLLMNIMMSP